MTNKTKSAIIVVAVLVALAGGYFLYDWARKNNKKIPIIDDIIGDKDKDQDDEDNPPPPPPHDGKLNVAIVAYNDNDSYIRDFNIFTSDPSGTYDGEWHASGRKFQYKGSGEMMELELSSGTYWFIVGSDPALGGYEGIIQVTGKEQISFSGVNWNKAVRFTV